MREARLHQQLLQAGEVPASRAPGSKDRRVFPGHGVTQPSGAVCTLAGGSRSAGREGSRESCAEGLSWVLSSAHAASGPLSTLPAELKRLQTEAGYASRARACAGTWGPACPRSRPGPEWTRSGCHGSRGPWWPAGACLSFLQWRWLQSAGATEAGASAGHGHRPRAPATTESPKRPRGPPSSPAEPARAGAAPGRADGDAKEMSRGTRSRAAAGPGKRGSDGR